MLVSNILSDSGTNFGFWHRAMIIALGAKNKLGFVDGSVPKPASTSVDHDSWIHNNHMTTSWILNSIAEELHQSVVYSASAKPTKVPMEPSIQLNEADGEPLQDISQYRRLIGRGESSVR